MLVFDNTNKVSTFVTLEFDAGTGGYNAFKVGEVLFGLKHLQTRMFREYLYIFI